MDNNSTTLEFICPRLKACGVCHVLGCGYCANLRTIGEQAALLKQNKIDMDSFATDPADDDNVCISCQ